MTLVWPWVAAGVAAAAAAAGTLGYAWLVEPERLTVTTVEVPIGGLDPALDGFRVVQLSDMHGRSAIGRRSLVEAVAAERPDLVAVTGDLVDARGPYDRPIEELRGLGAPAGVFFVPGNNESRAMTRSGAGNLIARLEKAGVTPLINRSTRVSRGAGWFWLAGVDDPTRPRRDDVRRALAGTDDGRPRLLLAHAPQVLRHLGGERVDYVLAGHTHGGQVCLPGYGPLVTRSPFGRRLASGTGWVGGVRVYVSRGIGTSLLPLRLACPPELVVHILRNS